MTETTAPQTESFFALFDRVARMTCSPLYGNCGGMSYPLSEAHAHAHYYGETLDEEECWEYRAEHGECPTASVDDEEEE